MRPHAHVWSFEPIERKRKRVNKKLRSFRLKQSNSLDSFVIKKNFTINLKKEEEMSPIDKALQKFQRFDRRPLIRNKTLYNRVINSMVTYELESNISSNGNLEILVEVLVRLVYKSPAGSTSASIARAACMRDMVQRYSDKIIADCRTLRLNPLAVFEAPESVLPRTQVIRELEKHQDEIFKVKPETNGNVAVSQNLLEKIGEKVWGTKVNPISQADKYEKLNYWTNQWSMKKQAEMMKKSNAKNSRAHTLTMNVAVGLEKLKCETLLEKGIQVEKKRNSKSRKRPLEVDDDRATKKRLLDVPKNKASTSIQQSIKHKIKKEPGLETTQNKRLSIVSVANISIPPVTESGTVECGNASTSTFNSSIGEMGNASINRAMVELITLMKTRDLALRKKDEEILQKLELYLHSLNVVNSSFQ